MINYEVLLSVLWQTATCSDGHVSPHQIVVKGVPFSSGEKWNK